jgi:MFS family permease
MVRNRTILLATGHGINDCIAGFFLGSLPLLNLSAVQVGLSVTVYNLLAFGGQYPIAILLEKTGLPKRFIAIACCLNVVALLFFYMSPQLAVFFAGIASAIYHVAGGTLCAEKNRATGIGIFAAPGVAGLIIGGVLAWKGINILPALLAMAILFFILVLKLKEENLHKTETENNQAQSNKIIEQHDLVMILLLIIISLRSVVWNVFELIHENNIEWLIAIAVSAFAGKVAGGWLADKIGWRLYVLVSTIAATPLIIFFKKELLLFCIGIGLLQSGIPATTSLLIQSIKGKTARGISLSFGITIILGAVTFIFPAETVLKQLPIILLVSIFLLLSFKMGNKKSVPRSPGPVELL